MKKRLIDLTEQQRLLALTVHKPTKEPIERCLNYPGMFRSWRECAKYFGLWVSMLAAVMLTLLALIGSLDHVMPFM